MATLSAISGLLGVARAELTGAPDNLITQKLREIGREFLRKTEIWTEDISVTLVEDQAAYTLTPTAGTVFKIESLLYQNEPALLRGFYLDLANSKLTFETGYVPGESLADQVWTCRVVLDVEWRDGDNDFPAFVLNRWGDGIANGAAGDLQRMSKRPWTDPNWSIRYEKYKNALREAKREKIGRGVSREISMSS